jgi:hypothetical protein
MQTDRHSHPLWSSLKEDCHLLEQGGMAVAVGMDSGAGKKLALRPGGRPIGGKATTLDNVSNGLRAKCVASQAFTNACHTIGHTSMTSTSSFQRGGEGVVERSGRASLNTLCQPKIIHIAVAVVGLAGRAGWKHLLLCREVESGAICSVRVTRSGHACAPFVAGAILNCLPGTDTDFVFDGPARKKRARRTLSPSHP